MEFVNERFLDAVFELIFIQIAKALPVVMEQNTYVPFWLRRGFLHPIKRKTKRPEKILRFPCAYALLGGRWGQTFDNCTEHYVFTSMALYFPATSNSRMHGTCRWFKLFQEWTNSELRSHLCLCYSLDRNIFAHSKCFLLDLYCFDRVEQLAGNGDSDPFDVNEFLYFHRHPAALNDFNDELDRLHFTSNPLISFRSLSSTHLYLPDVLNRLLRRQCDTEVVNSPEILDRLKQNQPKVVETYGKTLSVAIGSVGEIYKALEIDCFSEFRFRRARNERFSGEGFVERVKTSLKKRSSKEAISIVIEDLSLAFDLLGSAAEGVVAIDQDVSLTIKRRTSQVIATEYTY